MLLDLDVQPAVRERLRSARDATVQPLQHHGPRAARQLDPVSDPSDRTHGREVLLVLGHEQYALFLADVHGQRERHAREDDCVFNGTRSSRLI